MFSSTNLQHSRRLFLQRPFYHSPTPPPNYQLYLLSRPNGSKFDANVIIILLVLLCALICSLCLRTLLRCMLKCSNGINQGLNHNNIVLTKQHKSSCGVSKRALRTFQVIKYSKEGEIQELDNIECVICLSEFEEEELVRILPKCNHVFHVMCIDKWLNSHSSCPTCRQPLLEPCEKGISNGVLVVQREDIVRNYRG